jgi:hypothetical protein
MDTSIKSGAVCPKSVSKEIVGRGNSTNTGIQSSTATPDTKIRILARYVVGGVEHLIIELPDGTRIEMGPEGGLIKVFESSDLQGRGLLPGTEAALKAGTFRSSETSVNIAQLLENIAAYKIQTQGRTYNPFFQNSNYFVNTSVSGAGGNPIVPGVFAPAFGGVTGPVPYVPYGLVPAFGR